MPSQYAHLDGRRYVNADFVSKVREAYPATTKKIPLGYSTYTGWTGKDEVLFTEHQPLDDLAHLKGQLYEVTFDPSHPECFEQDILGRVSHSTVEKRGSAGDGSRRRLATEPVLEQRWGATLDVAVRRRASDRRKVDRARRLRSYLASLQAKREAASTGDEWIAWDSSDG